MVISLLLSSNQNILDPTGMNFGEYRQLKFGSLIRGNPHTHSR
ncbi:MAG: hypothetical protein VKL00_03305 [Synechococcales bacterium]|nr:hypothetical protein [Synechococcales bacterium]